MQHDKIFQEIIANKYVIKPNNEGSSIGVGIFDDYDEEYLKNYDFPYGEILIEEFIAGKELSVAVVGDRAIGVIELKADENFYDYKAKYTDGQTTHIMPAEISDTVYQHACDIAGKAHYALGCRGISRVDMRYDISQGESVKNLYILEINTQPGFTSLSILPEIAAYKNINFIDIIEILLNNADYNI